MQETISKPMTRDERQEIARVKWIKNKCRGVLVQPTGCGKTITALKCLKSVVDKYPNKKILVVVPTEPLKNQWRVQLDAWGMEFNSDVQIINTVIKYNWTVDILVLDECHRYGAATFAEVFNKVKYRYILGLTATFERVDGRHEVIAKYCPIIDSISILEAKANGWISDYTEYQVILDVSDIDIYKKYTRTFNEDFEFFNYDWGVVSSCLGKDGFKYRYQLSKQMCTNNEEKRKNILRSITYHATSLMRSLQARKGFINNHPKKLEIAKKIINSRPDSKIITFSNNVKMAESIGIGYVYTGKDSKKKGRITLEEFNNKPVGVINSINKLNEGSDIKGLSVGIILGLDSSEIKAVQRRGRVIRFEEGKKAEIFNLVINDTVETKWFTNGHPSNNYITIDELGLDDVLAGREPGVYNKHIRDFTFRY